MKPFEARVHAALLRGINVGPRNRVAMADLRDLLRGLGAEDVTTYLQSGNAVFRSAVADERELGRAIERAIADTLGVDVRVLIRSGAELARILSANPLLADGRRPEHLHVTFLAEAPEPARAEALEADGFAPDEVRVAGREAYLHCPSGYGRSKLGNAFLERRLGTAATTRNWKTVAALAELAAG